MKTTGGCRPSELKMTFCYTVIMCKTLLFKLELQGPSGVCPARPEGMGLFEMGRVPQQHPGLGRTRQKNLNTMSAREVQDAFSCTRRRVTAIVMLLSSVSGREGGTQR